jgi:hypothetical protein
MSNSSESPKSVQQAIQRGGTVREALAGFAESSHRYGSLAKAILLSGDKQSLETPTMVNPSINRSKWTTEDGRERIEFTRQAIFESFRVFYLLLHPFFATKDEPKNISRLLNEARNSLGTNGDPIHKYYLSRWEEFLAGAFTDPTFMQKLEAINPPDEMQKPEGKIVKTLKNFFGVQSQKSRSLLDQVLLEGANTIRAERKTSTRAEEELMANMSPRLHHYFVSHKFLPGKFFKDPDEVIENLRKHGALYLKFLWDQSAKFPSITEPVSADGLACRVNELPHGITLVYVIFPEPQRATEAYFAAIAYRPDQSFPSRQPNVARYFTLERMFSFGETPGTLLCERAPDGTHTQLGEGLEPTIAGFAEAIRRVLTE